MKALISPGLGSQELSPSNLAFSGPVKSVLWDEEVNEESGNVPLAKPMGSSQIASVVEAIRVLRSITTDLFPRLLECLTSLRGCGVNVLTLMSATLKFYPKRNCCIFTNCWQDSDPSCFH